MIKAAIFDMDGLLIDTEWFWQETEKEIFAGLGIELNAEMQKTTLGLRTDEQIKHWYNYKPWPNPDFNAIIKKFDEIIRVFYTEKAELMPGVEYILEFFKRRHLPLALASSSSMELIRTFLDKFAFGNVFSAIYSAEHEPYGKPHPGVYIKTAGLLGIHPFSCVAFEDSFNGLMAAKAARTRSVIVPDKEHFYDERMVIADLKLKSLKDFNEREFEFINTLK